MSGIAGISESGRHTTVEKMLDKISYRGNAGLDVKESENATLGIVYSEGQKDALGRMRKKNEVCDERDPGHLALARAKENGITLKRDSLGVAPLYFGEDQEGAVCFASEVKALIDLCSEVKPLPPGCKFDGENIEPYFKLEKKEPLKEKPEIVAKELRRHLTDAIVRRINPECEMGSWLSGGLDSSALAALARPHLKKLFTFAAGLEGSPDIEYAREVASFIDADHHEVKVEFPELIETLPDVIYHLESFDALLVRSSIMNYLVAERASDYVNEVFSGEGGDELFAGYHYLKALDSDDLPDELIDITRRLHNTALQRVDRSSSAHGTVAHVCYLDLDVVDFALRIPPDYKLKNNIEKWILRVALKGYLPEKVLNRKKAKFWKGAGVEDLLLEYAEQKISDDDFRNERILKNGWLVKSKEELLYYRIFKEHFGDMDDLSWMGRTKGVPAH